MQTQLQLGRNQEMFVATRDLCHTFFFDQGKHPCQPVVHQRRLEKQFVLSGKKRAGQFLLNKLTANNGFDR